MNADGYVTGFFDDPNPSFGSHGFVRDQNRSITVLDAPNAALTESFSINDRGDVTGFFLDASQNNKQRGYVRTGGHTRKSIR